MMKRICIFSCLLLAFLCLVTLSFPKEKNASQEPGLLQKIVISKAQNTIEVKIFFSPWTFARLFELSAPSRLILDLPNIENIVSASRYFEVNDLGIHAVRAGMFKTDVARVVFDLKENGQPPLYTIERIEGGVKVLFMQKQTPKVEITEPQIQTEKIPEEKPEVKSDVKKVEEKPDPPNLEVETQEPATPTSKEEEKLEKTKKILDEELDILNQTPQEIIKKRKNFVRIEALGDYFQPRGTLFKNVYKNGMMVGAEMNVGIWKFFEIWLAEKNFSKRTIDEASGEERRVNLIPLEAGLKFRLNKGNINPYFGLGTGYYQYREIKLSEEIREKKIGFIGQAGFFIKIGGYLIFDIYAHFSYCLIPSEGTKFNVGGLHFGLGFGFEY